MRPTMRCVMLFAIGIPVALLPAIVSPRLWTVWLAYTGVIVLITGIDAVLALPRRRLRIATDAPETLFIGDAEDTLTVELDAPRSTRGARFSLICDVDPTLAPLPERTAVLASRDKTRVALPLVPRRRGNATVEALWLRWSGPFGLVRRQVRQLVGKKIAVVPNVRAVRAAALRFFSARDFLAGLKVERYLGDGSEFESLREYVPGMDHRAMDWKSSARHRKLLVQQFRAERNHQIVMAVDTGHLMREPLSVGDAPIPRLDHAINAALLLGYFGLRTGDKVGLYAFDEKVRAYAEPQGGLAAFPRLQKVTSDLAYTASETNFTLGLAELSTRLKRRSLVVVLTDFVDVVTAELMIENLDRLARRHVVVFVTLRDPGLETIAAAPPAQLTSLYRSVVAGDFVRERELVLRRLRRLGIACLDAPPSQVSTQLLNKYLDIKRRELV